MDDIKTIEWYCIECKELCATYEQGLSCGCNNRWETEVLDPKDYPSKWKQVEVIFKLSLNKDNIND